ncbi:hypothetical protein P4B35_05000, partial [Pontiellaceae bacterium B12227]|nr:hypothetical protein [Pontiellaceae bacterium B12227]
MKRTMIFGAICLFASVAFAAELTDPGTYSETGYKPGTPAPLGHYVPTAGATAPVPAPPGYYIDVTGASAATQQTPPGTYAIGGASAPIPAPVGTYVSTTGASGATAAHPGTYVPTEGATSALLVQPGYYVSTSGASEQTPAQPGTYVPTAGATVAFLCPAGTTSYVASVACRIIDSAVSNEPPEIVGPQFVWLDESPVVLNDASSPTSFTFTVQNVSTDLAATHELTSVTILSGAFVGADATRFFVSNSFPITLFEGQTQDLNVTFSGSTEPAVNAQLALITDQYASIGQTGETQTIYIEAGGAPEWTDPGTYSETGYKPGIPASVGHYVPYRGATNQIPASPGYYVPSEGASAQIPAPIGKYASAFGQSVAYNAPPGTYTPTIGTASLFVAEPGFYAPGGGDHQIPASPGYYVPRTAMSSQIPASVGYYVPHQ